MEMGEKIETVRRKDVVWRGKGRWVCRQDE